MAQYWAIKAQYPEAILFFRLGDFYEMFGEDAQKAAVPLEVVLTARAGLPMCGVPYHASTGYIRKLIKAGFKVAICEQLEQPGASKGIVKRGVTRVITAGTILEDLLLDARQNNYLMSVCFDDKLALASLTAADISTGSFFTFQTSFKDFPSEIIKYAPGELLISKKFGTNQTVQNILSDLGVNVSTFDESEVDTSLAAKTFGKDFYARLNFKNNDIALFSVAALLSYLKKMQQADFNAFNKIKIIQNSDFMRLDAAAVKNLELLTSSDGRKEGSLLGAIDLCLTPMGSRMLKNWLIKPLTDIAAINSRYEMIGFFINSPELRAALRESFKTIADIERILARALSGSVSPKELISLKNSLLTLKHIAFRLNLDITKPFEDTHDIIDQIEITLNEEAPVQIKDGGIIKAGVNKDLDELRAVSSDIKKVISDMEIEERRITGVNNLKIGYTSVFGYYIELTKSNIAQAPAHYIRKQTLTNCERYITQELKDLEETILSSAEKILRLETELFNVLRRFVALKAPQISAAANALAELDIYAAFAENAVSYGYVKPKLTNTSALNVQGARHPVIEQILKSGEFVSNDINLDGERERIVILTGPNMSGKSTYLRQTALIVIMAQIGSFVPASFAEVGVCDAIFTRIGAGDNLAGGQSTFMVEMTETANIINSYTDKSLIILDEVGRGTSTYDGMSIAWACLEYFASAAVENKGSKILFATHYFELTALAEKLKGVINLSVAVKEHGGTVHFMHKIVKGFADKSYGIHVAKIAGLPHKLIERAAQILKDLEKNTLKPKEPKAQEEFFCSTMPQILVELSEIDTNALTPIEALNIISLWKEKYKN
jgi:DNA mismatch repair protein MutS